MKKKVLQVMPAENKPHRASSSVVAHLDKHYSMKRSDRHFLRAMLSPSISSVNHTRGEARVLDSRNPLAGDRKVG